jgi:hypothetical protein
MPPRKIIDPEKVPPWTPILGNIPELPPKPEGPREEREYRKAKKDWKDSDWRYRRTHPRPELLLPIPWVDIKGNSDYPLHTFEELEARRLDYLEILEQHRDRFPPEYYTEWHERFSKPISRETAHDRTGGVDGYYAHDVSHKFWREKSNSKYNCLPRVKMFPEAEREYKLREALEVKDQLGIPDDYGVDVHERTLENQQKSREAKMEEDRIKREGYRTTRWIDWDSDLEEMIDLGIGPEPEPGVSSWSRTAVDSNNHGKQREERMAGNPKLGNNKPSSKQEAGAAGVLNPELKDNDVSYKPNVHLQEAAKPGTGELGLLYEPQSSHGEEVPEVGPKRFNVGPVALVFGIGAAVVGGGYGLYKLISNSRHKAKGKAGKEEEDDISESRVPVSNRKKLFSRAWSGENTLRTRSKF